ncbi:MAG TPA: sigma-70 family RNA polymerase sigma factor [Solirubrobacteraceae bacterium]|nr:sigma-70 family RNA polymerase sigma factor [Solirubrobacteraceae bacterium]
MSARSSEPVARHAATSRRYEPVRWCKTDFLLSRWSEYEDRAAREELVTRFLPLARRLAGHYRAPAEPIDDLMQVASLGLLVAIDRYDPARGIPFTGFAVPTILGELKHYYRSTSWCVHVPAGAQELALRVDRAARQMTPQSGRRARIAELAQRLEITAEDVRAGIAIATAHFAISLDAPMSALDSDVADTFADRIGAEDHNYELVEISLSVSAAATRLPDLEREALALRLERTLTQSEIARRLRCSQTQVSRLLRRAAYSMQELIDPPLGELEAVGVGRELARPARGLRRPPPRRR